ncbi:MAG TPA: hypothetical protein VLA12_23495 [Planctomycetaceae bacterium]|nr:hypothetical protein [Planctomycetaceae bacterium]
MAENSSESMNPNALSLEDAARLLTKVGGREISVEMLRSDVLSGAPMTHAGKYADYELNFCHWRKMQNQRLLVDWTCEAEHLGAVGCIAQSSSHL